MFLNFDKEILFFLTEQKFQKGKEKVSNLELDYLSQFLSEFQFLIYYIDSSCCNNIVYLNPCYQHYHILKYFFPCLNFYFNYEEDLKTLTLNDKSFSIISNIKQDEMEFQKIIIEKYQPYAALVDFYIPSSRVIKKFKYLDGLLIRKFFNNQNYNCKLIVQGVAYKEYFNENLKSNIVKFNAFKSTSKFMNPFSNDNKSIFKERGFYNNFDETAMTIIIIDYLKKLNKIVNFDSIIKILIYILDNLIKDKKINLDIEFIIN